MDKNISLTVFSHFFFRKMKLACQVSISYRIYLIVIKMVMDISSKLYLVLILIIKSSDILADKKKQERIIISRPRTTKTNLVCQNLIGEEQSGVLLAF